MSNDAISDLRLAARGWRWTRRPLVPASALPYAPPPQRGEFPTAWARTPAAVAIREVVQQAGLRPLLHAELTPRVSGLDVLDTVTPPVLFVANHSSHLDTALLLNALPDAWRRRTTVAAAADYFFDVWWRSVGSALAFNTFPIDRHGGGLTETPAALLADGWNIVVFPEGGRSPDGWLQPFRPGAAWLAQQAGVPVVPVGIRGAYAAMPRGRGWPKPGRPAVAVRFGPALHPVPGERMRELTQRLQAAVATLIDEEETTWWRSLQRRHGGAGAAPAPAPPPATHWRRVWDASASPPAGGRPRAWR